MARRTKTDFESVCARWVDVMPGTAVPCSSPYIGREVTLREFGAKPVRVVACASPAPLTAARRAKLSLKRQCERSFLVSGGIFPLAVPASRVRERLREREGLCPDALTVDPHHGFVGYTEREAEREGVLPFSIVGELPFPHRRGGSPCCRNSLVSPDAVSSAWRDAYEGGDEADEAAVVERARRMVPKALRGEVTVTELADVPRAVAAVQAHCWDVVRQWEARAQRSAGSSSAREAAAERRAYKTREAAAHTAARAGSGEVREAWSEAGAPKARGRKPRALKVFRVG